MAEPAISPAVLAQPALEAWGRAIGEAVGAGEIALPLTFAFRGPLGAGKSLTHQQAYDIAAYISSRPRLDSPGKENDWPNGGAPADAPYSTRGHAASNPPPLLRRANPASTPGRWSSPNPSSAAAAAASRLRRRSSYASSIASAPSACPSDGTCRRAGWPSTTATSSAPMNSRTAPASATTNARCCRPTGARTSNATSTRATAPTSSRR